MPHGYEINDFGTKEDSWRMFRLMGEFVEGFDRLSDLGPAVTIYGSARLSADEKLFEQTRCIAFGLGQLGFTIITGGGPGVMAAANKGAHEAGVLSVGLNIQLPKEQVGNEFSTRTISFNHFFVRKVMLVKYATAFIIMPGGLGTLDELTEVLTLMQTHKIIPFPVLLFDSGYWNGFLTWLKEKALARKYIDEVDFSLLRIVDEPADAIDVVQRWYIRHELTGRKALSI